MWREAPAPSPAGRPAWSARAGRCASSGSGSGAWPARRSRSSSRGSRAPGKELIARAIHEEGPRSRGASVPVNCAVLGAELFDAELFGHTRGAFTGASHEPKGLLALSSGGTVFLYEVAELTPRARAKFLRALQDGEVRRLGENRTERLDLRVVAATNRPLDEAAGRAGSGPTSCTASKRSGSRRRRSANGGRAPGAPLAGQRPRAAERPGERDGHGAALRRHRAGAPPGRPPPAGFPRPTTLAAAREDLEWSMVRDALDRHGDRTAAARELGLTRACPG